MGCTTTITTTTTTTTTTATTTTATTTTTAITPLPTITAKAEFDKIFSHTLKKYFFGSQKYYSIAHFFCHFIVGECFRDVKDKMVKDHVL